MLRCDPNAFLGSANLPQLLEEMVVPRGNAPRSLAYQASALLLSYGTERVSNPMFTLTATDEHPSINRE